MLDKSEKLLGSARKLLEAGDADGCCLLSYAAVWQAMVALFEHEGIRVQGWTHMQIHSQFVHHFTRRRKLFASDFGDAIEYVYKARNEAEYGAASVDPKRA